MMVWWIWVVGLREHWGSDGGECAICKKHEEKSVSHTNSQRQRGLPKFALQGKFNISEAAWKTAIADGHLVCWWSKLHPTSTPHTPIVSTNLQRPTPPPPRPQTNNKLQYTKLVLVHPPQYTLLHHIHIPFLTNKATSSATSRAAGSFTISLSSTVALS